MQILTSRAGSAGGPKPGRAGFYLELAGLLLGRTRTPQKTRHGKILIYVRPVNVLAVSDKAVLGSLFCRSTVQTGIPLQRNDDGAPICKMNDQFSLSRRDIPRARRCFKSRRSHAMPLGILPDVL